MKTKMTDQIRSLEDECEFLNDKIVQLEKEIETKAIKYFSSFNELVTRDKEKKTIKNMKSLFLIIERKI
jgi:hypothetical protein